MRRSVIDACAHCAVASQLIWRMLEEKMLDSVVHSLAGSVRTEARPMKVGISLIKFSILNLSVT